MWKYVFREKERDKQKEKERKKQQPWKYVVCVYMDVFGSMWMHSHIQTCTHVYKVYTCIYKKKPGGLSRQLTPTRHSLTQILELKKDHIPIKTISR